MLLFCSMMHVASGRVRRKLVRLCFHQNVSVFLRGSISQSGIRGKIA